MKKKSTSKSAFFNLRVLVGVFIASVGILLALVAIGAFSNVSRADAQGATGTAGPKEIADERNPEFEKRRHQFLESFFGRGPGGVSPSEYATALDAARALPTSLPLEGQKFVPQAPQATWTFPISPPITNSYGGDATARVHALAIDPTSDNVVYTASFGGLAKTTDGGSTWQYLSNAWSSQSVTSIAVDYNRLFPSSHNYIYVGTGREDAGPYGVGIYRSFDGGASWAGPFGAAQFSGTAILAIAAVGSGSQSNATLYVVNKLGFGGGSQPVGLWRSTDSGSTWTQLRQRGGDINGYTGIFDVAVSGSSIFITEDDGVFKSVDSGQNWTLIHDVPDVPGAHDRLAMLSSTLYLMQPGDPNQNFYKSTNGGSTWAQIPTHCPVGANNCAGTEIGFAVFAVDPRNPNIILAGHYDPFNATTSLWRTDNEGASWTDVGGGIHPDQHAIAFSWTGSIAYEGNDGGIVKSTDTGQHWTNLNHNFPGALLYSVALSGNGDMIAGTQDSGVVYSNQGAAWNMINGGDSNHDLIDPVGNTWAYLEIYDIRSISRFNRVTGQKTDIHPTQLESDRACAFFPALSMNLSSPTRLVAGCQQLVRTLDGTASPVVWTTIGSPVAGGFASITDAKESPSDSNVIYAITTPYDDPYYTSQVRLTANANSGTPTWSTITPPSAGHLQAIAVHPTDPRTAYVAGTKAIYKTTDMGGSWSQIGILNLVYHDVAISSARTEYVYVASNAGVFHSVNGGLTWANISDGIPQGMAVTSLSHNVRDSFTLAAATYGRGVYTRANSP